MAKDILIRCKSRSACLDFKPSQVAVAAFFLSVWMVEKLSTKTCQPLLQVWNDNLAEITGYTVKDIEPIFKGLQKLVGTQPGDITHSYKGKTK